MSRRRKSSRILPLFALVLAVAAAAGSRAGDKPLTFAELMQFRTIHDAVISKNGHWVAYALVPDRGDGEAVVRAVESTTEYRLERGSGPQISADERWVAAALEPPLAEREKSDDENGEQEEPPKKGLALLDLRDGSVTRFEMVEAFAFSEDGRWLAYKLCPPDDEEISGEEGEKETETIETAETPAPEIEPGEEKPVSEEPAAEPTDDEEPEEPELGSTLILRELARGEEIAVDHVTEFAFDEPATVVAYAVSAPKGEGNGVFLRHLGAEETSANAVIEETRGRYTHLTWAKDRSRLAFVAAPVDAQREPGDGSVWIWDEAGARRAATRDHVPDGWTIPSENDLRWSRDGERLFFGFKPLDREAEEENQGKTMDDEGDDGEPFDPYDLEVVLEKRAVDVWHWNDPLIMSNQKASWEEEKDRVYRAVYHRSSGRVVPLADRELRLIEVSDNPRTALARADVPYFKERTWDGSYADVYAVDVATGERRLVAKRLEHDRYTTSSWLSPEGRYVIYYMQGHWHLYDVGTDTTRNVTADLEVPFADEDHDYPSEPPGYGVAEWIADDSAVLIYDKYDVWQIPTDSGAPLCLTEGVGRERELTFRVVDLDPEQDALDPGAPLLMTASSQREKNDAFYTGRLGEPGVAPLYEPSAHRLRFLAKAEEGDRILFTRERYDEFPDLRSSVPDLARRRFGEPRKLSDTNPQIAEYAWGTAELVEWSSLDGIPLQGVLIKPGNFEPGKRYPVLVYFYRFFSQRLHQFNEPVVNHRPSFPLYASNGYAVFLPDVRFEIGRPGFSATKCLVPGVQKLIELGIADPGAIALHGHSWSGYQTAFVVTQTDIFKAAVAGAPVANMTSAYSGIRLETGLARQFQYERSQSRIGGSLWEYPERYIENSPVFYADRIKTPLLIQFGDQDEAVPWHQGVELYLACRRLEKECIFLQYRGEAHHLKQYANKLDYSIKMKEFLDHHLKGAPAPEWMTEGVPYRGD